MMLDSSIATRRRELVSTLVGRGMPTTKIAAQLGVPANVVRSDRLFLSAPAPTEVKTSGSGARPYPMSREERLAKSRYEKLPEVTAKRRAAVREMCAAGKKDSEIAIELGVSTTTITRDRRRLGLARKDFSEPTVARREAVKEMLESGITKAEMARRLNVAITTILKDCDSLGGESVSQRVRAVQNREKVRGMVAAGMPIPEMARELKVAEWTVRRYLKTIAEQDSAA